MSDMGHMDRRYLWRANKAKQRVHIENPETGRTFCQVENCGGRPLDGKGTEVPAGRRVCGNCIDLAGRSEADYREPSLAVLLGERIADAEPELFTSIKKPLPSWEGFSGARSGNRSRGRKPKRSNVKIAKPFDDGLPW